MNDGNLLNEPEIIGSASKSNTQRPGGSLDGFTAETFASSPSVLETTRSGKRKGLQQYFTPPQAALFIKAVVNPLDNLRVFDPAAGDGSLLWPHAMRFGVELHEPTVRSARRVAVIPSDPRYTALPREHDARDRNDDTGRQHPTGAPLYTDQSYVAIRGDIQHVYPLLRVSGTRFSAFVANPPFGLTWQVNSLNEGRPASSTLLTWLMCMNLSMNGAQGALIAGTARLDREILSDPEAERAVYCVVDVAHMFGGVDLPCSIVFWCDPECRINDEKYVRLAADSLADLQGLVQLVINARLRTFDRLLKYDGTDDRELVTTAEMFPTIQDAYRRRTASRVKESAYDLQLKGDRIEVRLSSLAIVTMDRQSALYSTKPFLLSLHNQRSSYFALNTRDWRRLGSVIDSDLITMDPNGRAKVDAIVREATAIACPIYPIEPQQRLAYIQDIENLTCIRDDPERRYVAGESYPVDVSTEIDYRERTETKVVAGEVKSFTFRADYKVLRIMVGSDNPVRYCETKDDIDYLLAHFDIPDPGDVSSRYPDAIERWIGVIRQVQASRMTEGSAPRPFQVEDVARLLFKGSGVLSWEQGGGKTFGSMLAVAAFEEAAQSDGNALFIVPQDLIPQWRQECGRFFGRDLTHVTTRAQARRILRGIKERTLSPAWYVTHYEALAIIGVRTDSIAVLDRIEEGLFMRKPRPVTCVRGKVAMEVEPIIRQVTRTAADDEEELTSRWTVVTSADICPRCHQGEDNGAWDGYHCRKCGETRAHLVLKPMAHELATAFKKGCIVVDEGTKIKADNSLTSLAVRGLRARHRILLTGTPQKNYVHDMFHLLCWALGPASVRFPFAWGTEGKSKFESDFCVIERLVGGKRRKVLPEVTNLSVLWRLLSGAIIRRRKEHMGESIVDRTFMPMTVPFGTRQREQYLRWLNGFTLWYADRHPELTHKAIDRQAAILGQFVKLEYATTLPCADPDANQWQVGVSNWTPKMLKVLEISGTHASAGEQVLIGSDLMQTGRFLSESLRAKGVSAGHILDESGQTLDPGSRAARIREFTKGDIRVLCASIQSISLGHNLDCASVVILAGLPWDFATLDQFLARVHRLTSSRPVTVYVVLTEGSLDERKWKLLQDKTASAELAIDGHLVQKKQKPISYQQILDELKRKGLPIAETVLESDIQDSWQRFSVVPEGRPLMEACQAPEQLDWFSRVLLQEPLLSVARVKQLTLFGETESVNRPNRYKRYKR